MTAKTHIGVAAHPDFDLQVKMKPLEFEFGGEASFAVTTGEIRLHFDEIPIHVAIPFLPRRVVAGSLGPFGVRIAPFEAKFRAFDLHARGALGDEKSDATIRAKGNYKADVELSGKLPDQFLEVAIKKIVEK